MGRGKKIKEEGSKIEQAMEKIREEERETCKI